jgi:hypothetical protein
LQDPVTAANDFCELFPLISLDCRGLSKDVDASGPLPTLRTVDEYNADVDKSVLSAITGSENTDVRIAIGSIGREYGDDVFLIRTLDVLIV